MNSPKVPRKVVPLRPPRGAKSRKQTAIEGAPQPGALTLADVALRRTIGRNTTTYRGEFLARLIDATESPEAWGYPPDRLLEPGEIATELYELDQVVSAIGHAVHDHYDDDAFGMAFSSVCRHLQRLGRRVLALSPPANRKAAHYHVIRTGARR